MPYDEGLAQRVREVLEDQTGVTEKKMFGGLCFMVDGKMCIGVEKEKLMARVGPDAYKEALGKPGCREMDFTGRPMNGYVFVEPDGVDMEKDLEYFVQKCLDFNPLAKSSKKKKKK